MNSHLIRLGNLALSGMSFAISFFVNSLSASLSADRTAPRCVKEASACIKEASGIHESLYIAPVECQ